MKQKELLIKQKKRKAWDDFKAQYPNADLSKFNAQVSFNDNRQATAEVSLSPASQDRKIFGMMMWRKLLE